LHFIFNIKIERWWKELNERIEKYFKEHLNWLKDQGHYNPHLERDRLPLISSLVSMNVTNPLLWAFNLFSQGVLI
jgi:hypothetical protein